MAEEINNQRNSTVGHGSEQVSVKGMKWTLQKFKDDNIGIPNVSDAVFYTQAEANTFNAKLTGALDSTTPLTAEQAAAYNEAITGAEKEYGDILSESEANLYNSTLEGAVSTDDVKTPAVPKKVKDYVDDHVKNEDQGNGIGTCSTAAATAAKEVALTGYELVKNGFVAVTFTYDVPANATLNINSKGAKPIYYQGAAIEAGVIKAGDTVTFCYDGTNYVISSFCGGGGSFNPEYEHIYDAVTSTTGKNPAQEGWYEIVSGAYVLTEDTTPQSGKTYYIQQDYYEMII